MQENGLSKVLSSLPLANMGQDKGLRWHKPVPTPESLESGLPAWHCASLGEWYIFHEVTGSLGQALGSSKFLEPDPLVPIELPYSVPGARPLSPAAMNQAFWKAYKSKVLQTLGGESEEDLAEEVGTGHVF